MKSFLELKMQCETEPTSSMVSPESPHSNISTENPTSSGFDQTQVIRITIVSILCLFGICTNSLSLYKLSRERLAKQDKSRMTLLLIHLSLADLIVILFQVPEVWSLRGVWKADDVTCRITSFFQIFGFFISGFVMMVISVDRWSAIIHPLTSQVPQLYCIQLGVQYPKNSKI